MTLCTHLANTILVSICYTFIMVNDPRGKQNNCDSNKIFRVDILIV